MKKIVYFLAAFFAAQHVTAQIPEDAIRISWTVPSGTARQQAIGGAMGSLGGEITSTFVNPAGLGFYKTGEFVVSPGLSFFNGSGDFRGTSSDANSYTKFNIGTTGLVWGQTNPRSRWANKTFSFAINRTANFNGRSHYEGLNTYSSYSESFAEEFAQSGLPIDVRLYDAPLSLGTKLANYTYLIDTVTVGGGIEVVGLPLRDAILNNTDASLYQSKDIRTRGGITELAFGFASNLEDRIYIGGSIGLPIVNFKKTTVFTERDLDNNINNFNYSVYQEDYKANGVGLNAKLGIIVKASEQFRAGFALHTPTIYGLSEQTTGRMENDLEDYFSTEKIRVGTTNDIYTANGYDIPSYRYDLISPWKFMLSGSYMINAVADVTKQKGFITADVEYVTHRSSRFNSGTSEDQSYYSGVNDAIKLSYKNAVNVRVGGELKFNTFMTRLGFAYYGSPYEEKEFKAKKMNLSGGVGYRHSGIFLDLTYVYGINRDVDFPYRLSDKANTYAELKNNNANVILTFGVKF